MQKLQEWLQDVLQRATHWIVIIMLPQGLKPLPDLLQLGTRTCVHGGAKALSIPRVHAFTVVEKFTVITNTLNAAQ